MLNYLTKKYKNGYTANNYNVDILQTKFKYDNKLDKLT